MSGRAAVHYQIIDPGPPESTTLMHGQSSPNVTAPAPAVLHGAVTHIPWVDRHLQRLFWACAAVLAPWVVFLYLSQVPRAQA